MNSFNWGEILTIAIPAVTLAVGAGLGYGLGALKGFIARTSNKLDDAIWNKLVNEFTAVGVIDQNQLSQLKNMPTDGNNEQK